MRMSKRSKTEISVYNSLVEENAGRHLAFGQSYAASLETHAARSPTPAAAGTNESSVHIDCMFGNASMNVDGIPASGAADPIMRDGEFVR